MQFLKKFLMTLLGLSIAIGIYAAGSSYLELSSALAKSIFERNSLTKKLQVKQEVLSISKNAEDINVNVYWWQRGCEESFESIKSELDASIPKNAALIKNLDKRIANCEAEADKVQAKLILHKQAEKENDSAPIIKVSDNTHISLPILRNQDKND